MARRTSRASQPIFGDLTRRQYWIGITLIVLALVSLSYFRGCYHLDLPQENADEQLHSGDPLTGFLWSPLGNAVVLFVLQLLAANVLLLIGLWVRAKLRRGDA
jgi:hypothetical protein